MDQISNGCLFYFSKSVLDLSNKQETGFPQFTITSKSADNEYLV